LHLILRGRGRVKRHRVAVINSVCCAVIGGTFGFVTQNLIPWLLASALLGVLAGLGAEALFRRLHVRPERYLRGLLAVLLVESFFVLYVVIPANSAYYTVHPVRVEVSVAPADVGLAYEDVTLVAED
jgi:integral membrane sensor domain MASE1